MFLGRAARKAIRAAVERNRLLLTPLQGHFADLDEDFGGGELTYFLLHRIDPVSYSIQAELSLPTSIDGTDLGGFHERITIPDPTEARDVTIDEGKEEDFKVKPKSG